LREAKDERQPRRGQGSLGSLVGVEPRIGKAAAADYEKTDYLSKA
jgi:hypothetical protein